MDRYDANNVTANGGGNIDGPSIKNIAGGANRLAVPHKARVQADRPNNALVQYDNGTVDGQVRAASRMYQIPRQILTVAMPSR
jgi:hypothetical protein